MKIYLGADNLSAKHDRQRLKLAEVHYLLDRHESVRKRGFLRKLADFLVFPEGYLTTLPAPVIASLIVRFLNFLEIKRDIITLKTVSVNANKHHLMMLSLPNAPYLVETLLSLQQNHADTFTLLAHPVLAIKRKQGQIMYLGNETEGENSELFILVRLENTDIYAVQTIQKQCQLLLSEAYLAFQRIPLIKEQFERLKFINNLSEYQALINWLQNDGFIPLVYQQITEDSQPETKQTIQTYSGLDLLRSLAVFTEDVEDKYHQEISLLLSRDTEVIVQALSLNSPVISREPLIYIGFREKNGTPSRGEHAFIGLFNKIELNCPSCTVSVLQKKIEDTLIKTKLLHGSHDYIRLQEIFGLIPKLELFFLAETQLYLLAQSLCRYLYQPDTIKLLFLASPSPFRIALLIVMPQHFFEEKSTVLQQIICTELSSIIETARIVNFGGNYRALYLSVIPNTDELHIDISALEKLLNRKTRPWEIKFRQLLERIYGKTTGSRLWYKYHDSFGGEYRAMFPPRCAVKDIVQIEKLSAPTDQRINLIAPFQQLDDFRLHFYSVRERFLDEYIPVLENLNLRLIDQVQFSVNVDGYQVFIKSFAITAAIGRGQQLYQLKPLILDIIQAILDYQVDNDALNRLLVMIGMSWKEIDVLRAYRNYYLQLNYHSTASSFHDALLNNPTLAKSLYDYFEVRFRPSEVWDDPRQREEQGLFPVRLRILQEIETVADMNDDKILRTLFNLIDATVRSNFHVRRNLDDYFIAFKISSLGVIDMPAPKPLYEIYVHGANMEGIHVRGGQIARGGIRWSDRRDDFRTEILDLMRTQMSKNALIVPTGAKGGFVVKNQQSGESFSFSGKKAYIRLMKGLLDLTDNFIDEHVVTLPGIVRYDDSDPYLVVAADKGTAPFSDVANVIAAEYSFWMGDAFASGGSKGYNHKALAITARGAWEGVKRHFREIGTDIQSTTFTVVGIGSMDGDVFGNAMLLSGFIKLRAAISGEHIFIDPEPNPAISFQERKRLFELPGSSWGDYDTDLVSEGGGVYLRNSKDIPVSVQLQQWLGIHYKVLDGETLIRYLLTASVDLLWMGGVGTYVKASTEKQEDVGDRNNDNVRVDANILQAKVVGEGANLGFTQKARVEFALAGGRINTDAIDNSAGVDTSDHEVNLKILLNLFHKRKLIDDYQDLLNSLTEEVCASVLFDNYAQTLCLSLEQIRCREHSDRFLDLAEHLQSAGFLDITVDSFPNNKQLLAREGEKLSRPELAVLMSAAKRWLRQQIQEVPGCLTESCYDGYLLNYFPVPLVEQYARDISVHPLASEIKATYICNLLINQAGCCFLNIIFDEKPDVLISLVSTYLCFDCILNGDSIRKAVFKLDNKISADRQYRILLYLESCLSDFCYWSIANNAALKPDSQTIASYQKNLQAIKLYGLESETEDTKLFADLPDELAENMRFIKQLHDFPAIVKVSVDTNIEIDRVLTVYADTGQLLYLNCIEKQLQQIPLHDTWERKVLADLQQGFKSLQGELVRNILHFGRSTAASYFEEVDRKLKLQGFLSCYHQADETYRLMPYVVLYKELQRLLE